LWKASEALGLAPAEEDELADLLRAERLAEAVGVRWGRGFWLWGRWFRSFVEMHDRRMSVDAARNVVSFVTKK